GTGRPSRRGRSRRRHGPLLPDDGPQAGVESEEERLLPGEAARIEAQAAVVQDAVAADLRAESSGRRDARYTLGNAEPPDLGLHAAQGQSSTDVSGRKSSRLRRSWSVRELSSERIGFGR